MNTLSTKHTEGSIILRMALNPLIVAALAMSALVPTAAPAADTGACPQNSAGAETCTVNTPRDGKDFSPGDGRCETSDGVCTLRAAIEETNEWCKTCLDRVVLPGRKEPYLLTALNGGGGRLRVNGRVSVQGSAKTAVTGAASVIDGNNPNPEHEQSRPTFPVFHVDAGNQLFLDGVVIVNGHDHIQSGGIVNNGSVSIRRSWLRNNSTHGRIYGGGGAVYNTGVLVINQSTFSDNWSIGGGSAISGGGAVRNVGGRVTAYNSTFTGNQAREGGRGGAISNIDGGSVKLYNTTIAKNRTTQGDDRQTSLGGGVYNQAGSVVSAWNSIIADNNPSKSSLGPWFYYDDCLGSINLMGYDLLGDVDKFACDVKLMGDGNLVGGFEGIDPQLGPLSHNGGPTPTLSLKPGSPAIDAGFPIARQDGGNPTASCLPEDQRGTPRPADGPNEWSAFDGDPVCDIGAYEYQSPVLSFDDPTVTGKEPDGAMKFMVCLSQAQVEKVSVIFTTDDYTATAGSDYVSRNQLMNFAPGTKCLPIWVRIINNTDHEDTEKFLVHLNSPTSPTQVRFAVGYGEGTILDDD